MSGYGLQSFLSLVPILSRVFRHSALSQNRKWHERYMSLYEIPPVFHLFRNRLEAKPKVLLFSFSFSPSPIQPEMKEEIIPASWQSHGRHPAQHSGDNQPQDYVSICTQQALLFPTSYPCKHTSVTLSHPLFFSLLSSHFCQSLYLHQASFFLACLFFSLSLFFNTFSPSSSLLGHQCG